MSGSIANTTVMSAMINAYLCPADLRYPVELGDWAWTSYAGNRGVGAQKHGENGAFEAFPLGRAVRFSEFTDGLSGTVLSSEWVLGGYERKDRDPRRAVFDVETPSGEPAEFDQFAQLCHDVDVATARVHGRRKGMDWTRGEFGYTLYNHTLGPNDHACLGNGYQNGAWTAGSWHPGGANVLFADSSTRFIRQTVDLAVWRALGSRNGGEAVSEDSY